jgi:hypothetical protein
MQLILLETVSQHRIEELDLVTLRPQQRRDLQRR